MLSLMEAIFTIIAFYVLIKFTDHYLSAKGYKGKVSDHFSGSVFYSYGKKPIVDKQKGRTVRILKWLLSREKYTWKWRDRAEGAKPRERVHGNELVVTFINHATLLIQTQGLNILTDPIWSKRASPFSFIGPARFQASGIAFADLPPIDVVVISHNHYDHMDIATLLRIRGEWDAPILTALGNADYLKARHIGNVHDMDWWDRFEHKGVTIVCVPGQHFSSRALSDRNKTLWCGFVIETKGGDIYFAGDTGYGPFTESIRSHYKKFRLAMLPIGAFRPEWFMGGIHISPLQAMHMHRELHIETSIGIHHSTFKLADDKQDEPKESIIELVRQSDAPKPNFLVLQNGESATIA